MIIGNLSIISDCTSVVRFMLGFLFAVKFVEAFRSRTASFVRPRFFSSFAFRRRWIGLSWLVVHPMSFVQPIALRLHRKRTISINKSDSYAKRYLSSVLREKRFVALVEKSDIFSVDAFSEKLVKYRHFIYHASRWERPLRKLQLRRGRLSDARHQGPKLLRLDVLQFGLLRCFHRFRGFGNDRRSGTLLRRFFSRW